MPVEIAKNGTDNIFTADYRAPFGGVNSSAYPTAIPGKDFTFMDGIYISNNILKTINFIPFNPGTLTLGGSEQYLGYIPWRNYNNVQSQNAIIGHVITDQSVYQVIANSGGGTISLSFNKTVTYTPAGGPSGNPNTYFHYIIINQVTTAQPQIYWTANGWHEIWMYDILSATATLVTNYVGGGVLGLLNNQLMNIGGYSAADGFVPNRISWSAPGQYGQFQPYDVGSGTGNYSAGFNDLPSTSDIPTNFFTIGTIAYIFRQQGITQVSPTGTGIAPFTFNHLWASEQGIGGAFVYGAAQYGSAIAFLTDNNAYTLGLSGLQEVSAEARSAIFKVINQSAKNFHADDTNPSSWLLKSVITPYVTESPDVFWLIGVVNPIIASPAFQFVGISLSNQSVYTFGNLLPFTVVNSSDQIGLELSYFPTYLRTNINAAGQVSNQVSPIAVYLDGLASTGGTVSFYFMGHDPAKVGTVTFKKEQLGFLQEPTVSKGLLLASLINITENGNVNMSFDGGLTYPVSVAVTAGVGNPGLGIIDDLIFDYVQTLERPQLSLQLTNIQVAEAWYQGTFEDYTPI